MQEEEKSVVRTLYAFIYVALAGSVLIVVSALLQWQGKFTTFALSGIVGVVTCLVVLWLLRVKQFAIPRILLPSVTYLLATYLIFTGTTVSVRDDAVLLYSLGVAMAGLLLRRRGVVIFGVLSVVTVLVSIYAEIHGMIVNHITPQTTTYTTMITVGVTYGLTFTMMFILVNILTNNLAKSRSGEQALAAANAELNIIRESLEKQVTERTALAESARADAELARHEAEAQAWFTRGQANLADKMRGDLDVPILANNVISFLCQYLGAQAGALFLADGNKLILTGRYSYTEHANQKQEFLLGEGLIGEAARDGRVVIMMNVPQETQWVSSALGEAKPNQLLIAPIEADGQVFGAVELGTLNQFSAEHEAFLRRISESVAIAFRTAQTRIKVNELLAQSQMRAEDRERGKDE
jgi:putative methionine-R-sulfoxide reductase with GAF domain